jgi:hypothetical protein
MATCRWYNAYEWIIGGGHESSKHVRLRESGASGVSWQRGMVLVVRCTIVDLDSVTADASVEKHGVEISRTFSDVLQVALTLKGDGALVLANQAKEEHTAKRNDSSKLVTGSANHLVEEGCELNADGTRKTEN